MISLGGIEVISTDYERLDWGSLWRSPSSPPYNEAQSRNPFSSPNQRSTASDQNSSPSTPSEFEFDSIVTLEIKDEPPVSPKFISSSATGYWAAVASSLESGTRTRTQISSSVLASMDVPSVDPPQNDAPTLNHNTSGPLSHSRKQASTPPSPSVRQLITEEMRTGEHVDNESDLDFYSAPQTQAQHSTPKQRLLSLDYEPSPHFDKQLITGTTSVPPSLGQRKSLSAALERRADAVYPNLTPTTGSKGLTPSKSEPGKSAHFNYSSASSSSILHASEDEKTSAAKKPGSSKSFKKWAFKDFLRRTVPSSKADAHYITRTLDASSSSPRSFFSTSRSTPILVSPQASPPRSHPGYHIDSTFGPPTPHAGHPSSRALRSPPHRPPSTHSRSPAHALDAHSDARAPQHLSTPSRTPGAPSPRSPMSPHAAHYKLQKAQSQELGRKTFLPYRQSLLGCLGGSGAFSSDQLVW